jgi:hypothetical protein
VWCRGSGVPRSMDARAHCGCISNSQPRPHFGVSGSGAAEQRMLLTQFCCDRGWVLATDAGPLPYTRPSSSSSRRARQGGCMGCSPCAALLAMLPAAPPSLPPTSSSAAGVPQAHTQLYRRPGSRPGPAAGGTPLVACVVTTHTRGCAAHAVACGGGRGGEGRLACAHSAVSYTCGATGAAHLAVCDRAGGSGW